MVAKVSKKGKIDATWDMTKVDAKDTIDVDGKDTTNVEQVENKDPN